MTGSTIRPPRATDPLRRRFTDPAATGRSREPGRPLSRAQEVLTAAAFWSLVLVAILALYGAGWWLVLPLSS
jgi:hypothetical protein